MAGYEACAAWSGVTTAEISLRRFGADEHDALLVLPAACALRPLNGHLLGFNVTSMDGDESTADAGEVENGSTDEPAQVELLVQSPKPRTRAGSRQEAKLVLTQEFEMALGSVANCELVPDSVSLSAQTIAAFTDTASVDRVTTEIEAKGFRVYLVTDQQFFDS